MTHSPLSEEELREQLPMNKIEAIIADHNKAMRTDMASEIVGGTRSKAITDVITVKALVALITAQKEAWERETRIDELDTLKYTASPKRVLSDDGLDYADKRINELKKRGE